MTAAPTIGAPARWDEPAGIAARGTLVVVPGRGEHPGVYERFGRRIAADGYRVRAVTDPTDPTGAADRAAAEVAALLDDAVAPAVLVGSDTGALFAASLVARGTVAVAGLVLAGLALPGTALPGTALPADWDDEVAARTACPTHRRRLTEDPALRRGALAAPPPAWAVDPAAVTVPVLGLHGEGDTVAPLDGVRAWYAGLPDAELVGVADGRHDALNDATHRTAAATVVLFLERLRAGAPIARVLR
jgi:alpha-beta hydrolase superfamily lysophospholipase